ncbi:MAG: hypothetical protein K0S20_542 [Patescibacteria group bacterium]|jgi:UDP-N-acetylmuramyl tripeptide synthase|nr:hypothetical protein [Patescibacteria group bacterium]
MTIRYRLAVVAGKTTSSFLRLAGSGGGALPGLIAGRICPDYLAHASSQLAQGTILVTGTNGKTTTARMLYDMIGGSKLISNRSGSNMTRGHIAAFLQSSSWSGKPHCQMALLEVDEAVLPETVRLTKPRHLLLHNLFRDQLDRYGEVDSIARKWLAAFKKSLPKDCTLYINADDPNLAYLAVKLNHQNLVTYGLNDPKVGTETPTSSIDAHISPASSAPLSYTSYYVSHLGDYTDNQGFSRPSLTYSATNIQLSENGQSSSFSIAGNGQPLPLTLPLPGLYNVYNALAASAIALKLTVDASSISSSLQNFQGAFGRFERIVFDDKELICCLIKNPAGATEVLRAIAIDNRDFSLLLCLNDNFADGVDVSWYWDTPYEIIAKKPKQIIVTGTRKEDGILRLKYAGRDSGLSRASTFEEALETLTQTPPSLTYILATYTATLEIQAVLKKKNLKRAYWKE